MVETTARIGLKEDIYRAKNAILDVLMNNKMILSTPMPLVEVKEVSNFAVVFDIKAMAHANDYNKVLYYINEQVKIRLDKEGIEIPYPHAVQLS